MGSGPAGGGGGVKQTSGNDAITLPPPALQAISSPFANTSQPMRKSPSVFAAPKQSNRPISGQSTCKATGLRPGPMAFGPRRCGGDQLDDSSRSSRVAD